MFKLFKGFASCAASYLNTTLVDVQVLTSASVISSSSYLNTTLVDVQGLFKDNKPKAAEFKYNSC